LAEASTRTVERALALLATICERGSANLADSARDCDLAPSTALRLLRTLESTGFIAKDEAGLYRPGGRMIQLGAAALSSESLTDMARPMMEKLVAQTGESAYLSVEWHSGAAIYIGVMQGTHSVRHTSWVGRTFPVDISAAGHALRGDVGADGYVVVEGGVEPDVTAVACPVHSEARIVAALSLVVPSYRCTEADAIGFGALLVSAAAELSAQLSRSPMSASEERQA